MGLYTIQAGDTLSGIAARYGVDLGALENANPQIGDPDLIYPGQSLTIPDGFDAAPPPAPVNLGGAAPSGATYVVQAGDTLSAIGDQFGVSYQDIAAANGLADPNLIYPGQVLTIPGAAPVAPPAPAPTDVTYRVQPGDTLSGIGAKYGVSYQAIAAANGISNPDLIYPGQQLIIPGASGAPAPTPAPDQGPPAWTPGSGQLAGADTSSWQSDATFEQSIQGTEWAAVKATEGTDWTDPTFRARWDELGQRIQDGQMKLRIAYQFMHAGDGVGQAQHFLAALGINGPLQPGTRLALDWEADALSDPQALHDAANYIHDVTGVWPLIYTSGSQVDRARAAAPEAPIWEASWGAGIPSDVPFVQYSDGPGFDHDVFNGDLDALSRFAGW